MEIIKNLRDRAKILELGKVKDKTLLDIGTGPLAKIAVKDFNCHVTSIDISNEQLEKAREEALKENISSIHFEKNNAIDMSYENNMFDVVISYGTLHHIPVNKRKDFLIEVCRVARETIIIADFNEQGFPHSDNEYKKVDLKWLENELKSFNFEIEKYKGEEMEVFICHK